VGFPKFESLLVLQDGTPGLYVKPKFLISSSYPWRPLGTRDHTVVWSHICTATSSYLQHVLSSQVVLAAKMSDEQERGSEGKKVSVRVL
jgi:hypothetical protein